MKRVAIVSMNGISNVGGVERVVAHQAQFLSEIASVRIFSLPASGWMKTVRRSKLGNLLSCCAFSFLSSTRARVWAGRDGAVIGHAPGSIGAFCDVLFAHGCWAAYVRKTGTKMGPFGCFIYSAEWIGAHLAKKVVGVSESVIEQWIQHYGLTRARSGVQRNTVDTSVFFPRSESSDPCSKDTFRVLFVGRFEPGKGALYLSQLHQQLASANEPWQVVICSPTDVSHEIKNRHALFRFSVGLSAEEVAAECNKADMFLLPSLYEAFELSSIEALACGTPVLLNNTGARPTLEKLSCPGLFRLENAGSPLDALRMAYRSFKGVRRIELAQWAQTHFDGRVARAGLLALCNASNR